MDDHTAERLVKTMSNEKEVILHLCQQLAEFLALANEQVRTDKTYAAEFRVLVGSDENGRGVIDIHIFEHPSMEKANGR